MCSEPGSCPVRRTWSSLLPLPLPELRTPGTAPQGPACRVSEGAPLFFLHSSQHCCVRVATKGHSEHIGFCQQDCEDLHRAAKPRLGPAAGENPELECFGAWGWRAEEGQSRNSRQPATPAPLSAGGLESRPRAPRSATAAVAGDREGAALQPYACPDYSK